MRSLSIILLVTAFLWLSACVSSTTGPARTESSSAEAANNYYQLGARYYRNGNYNFARERLLRAIELDPQHAMAHSTLALTYMQLDNPRLATEHYDRAVRLAPGNFDVRNAYAVFLCGQREFDGAEEQFQRAIRIPDNDSPEIMLTNAGVCMSQKPDLKRAESYFRDALKAKPGYGEALLQMAQLERSQGDGLAARAFLQRYLSANAATPSVLYLSYKVEQELGNDRASGEFAARLLREHPDSPEAQYLREGR